mmetsp:Transcript_27261/g.19672  ORF Transcript_27261/g.19672 Transcript_27261/m.19672 type:complete len:130 (-) Transcript_27261:293-682(-)|eukprot:CAMPEP_0116882856 /NCGR_PEP_ID=MMETSP0463-20121206/15255_1 /TAXON_ID=181622 /ORGANISM="Strombidinopsis sp, Strain SopsisLIS2011" /LENGTH=129 /DNA_ID=CAMNT_0004536793 /DNA_START=831 /DNA_END=1220 /DNA_ORIENTATION=-
MRRSLDALPEFDPSNPQVFIDLEIAEPGHISYAEGAFVIELFAKNVPRAAENFRALCTGEKGEYLSYKGNLFHSIIPGYKMHGGDITKGDGKGGVSIYGDTFKDDEVWLPHSNRGIVSMDSNGPNTSNS